MAKGVRGKRYLKVIHVEADWASALPGYAWTFVALAVARSTSQ